MDPYIGLLKSPIYPNVFFIARHNGHIHRGWLGHHLTSTHRRKREEQGWMNREWLDAKVAFGNSTPKIWGKHSPKLSHVFKAGSNGEAKKDKRVMYVQNGKHKIYLCRKYIYSLAIFWNLVAITNSRFAQLFWPPFFCCPMSFSRELSSLLWAFATRPWQRSPRCGHGGFPG